MSRKIGGGAVASVGTFSPVDGSHRELIEASIGKKMSKEEWASVRQCIRCLTQGVRLVKQGDGPREVVPHSSVTESMDTTKAIALILGKTKSGKILKAARALTFIDE